MTSTQSAKYFGLAVDSRDLVCEVGKVGAHDSGHGRNNQCTWAALSMRTSLSAILGE